MTWISLSVMSILAVRPLQWPVTVMTCSSSTAIPLQASSSVMAPWLKGMSSCGLRPTAGVLGPHAF